MKAAVLLQGDPRFCVEFDRFLENFQECDQVDWFMYLWENNTSTANLAAGDGHRVVADSWQHVNRDRALQRFAEYLPSHHRVVNLALGDQNSVVHEPLTENFAQETRQANVWKMWYSLHNANRLRTEYERENNFVYDLVVRTRPDVALMNPIRAPHLKDQLDKDPNLVIIPNNKRCGYNGTWMCDLFAISSSKNMTVYCDLYNQALAHHQAGVIFHPETMLGQHLQRNNLRYEPGGFEIEFRHQGIWRDVTTGEEWTSNRVPNWHEKIYISEFGRWA